MRDLRVCVGCLATNVRMYSMIFNGLLEPYQDLFGMQILDAGMSDKLCWECAALVIKFRTFRFKCETAHRLLRDVYLQNFEVSEEKVNQIDRYLLISSLSISETKCYSLENLKVKDSPLQLKESSPKDKERSKKKRRREAREERKREKEKEPQSPKLEIEVVKTEEVMIKSEPEFDFEEYNNTDTDFDNREEPSEIIENKVEKRKKYCRKKRSLAPEVEYNVTEEVLSHDQAYEQYIERKSSLSYQKSNFKCSLCYQGFRDAPYYDKHMSRHSPKMGAFECEFCKMRFRSRRILVKHISRKHSKKYTCNLCRKVSYSRTTAKAHFELHKKKGPVVKPGPIVKTRLKEMRRLSKKLRAKRTAKARDFDTIEEIQTQEQMMAVVAAREHMDGYKAAPFKCKLCYKGFLERKTYTNHMLIHDPVSGEFECDICKLRVKSRLKLYKHISNNHLRKYTCKACGNICYNRKLSSHLSHLRIKHPSEHVCRICQQSFVSPMGLYHHTRMMHSVNRDEATTLLSMETCRVRCDACDIAFPTQQAFTRHVLISPKHELERASVENGCRVCGETFVTRIDLKSHRKEQHPPRVDKRKPTQPFIPEPCIDCGEMMESLRRYKAHFAMQHPGKPSPFPKTIYPFMCEVCGQGFKTRGSLGIHRNIHTAAREYKCELCAKSFLLPLNLRIHLASHSEERPFVCAVCGKGFKLKNALKRHARSHTGEKPYDCTACGKPFSSSTGRNAHMRAVHHKEPPPYVPYQYKATAQ